MAKNTTIAEKDTSLKDKKSSSLEKINTIGNYMLPQGFRKRSLFRQRLYLLILVFAYSFAIGFLTFSFVGIDGNDTSSIINKFNLDQNDTKIAIVLYLISVIEMFFGGLFIYWTRSRNFWISITEFVGYLLAPVLFIFGIVLIDKSKGANLQDFMSVMKITMTLIVVVPLLYGVGLAFIRTKTFSEVKVRALWLVPGMAIIASSGVMGSILLKPGSLFTMNTFVFITGPTIIGIFIFAIGAVVSSSKSPFNTETVWSQFRYTGALPAILAFSPLLALAIRSVSSNTSRIGELFSTPVVTFSMIIQLALIGLFAVYAIIRGRIKNVAFTNPWHNELILKSIVIIIAIVTLFSIDLLKNVQMPNYSFHSFFLLGFMSFSVLMVAFVAHFFNLVTYTKFYKLVVFGALASTILAQTLILYMSTLKDFNRIQDILSRQIAVVFVIITVAIDGITLFINVGYIFLDSMRVQRAKRAIQAREEEYQKMQDVGYEEEKIIDDDVDPKKKKKKKGDK